MESDEYFIVISEAVISKETVSKYDLPKEATSKEAIPKEAILRGVTTKEFDTTSIDIREHIVNSCKTPCKNKLNEVILAGVIKQILTGLHVLHSHNLVHGDIKLANVVASRTMQTSEITDTSKTTHSPKAPPASKKETSETTPVVKLRELGVSELLRGIYDRDNELTDSTMYMAPELCSGSPYDAKCDIWSCGILAFQLLSRQSPYDLKDKSLDYAKAVIKDSKFPGRVDEHQYTADISEQAKQFLKKMLTVEPAARPTAGQLLADDWLSTKESPIMKEQYTILDGAVNKEVRSLSTHRARTNSERATPSTIPTA